MSKPKAGRYLPGVVGKVSLLRFPEKSSVYQANLAVC